MENARDMLIRRREDAELLGDGCAEITTGELDEAIAALTRPTADLGDDGELVGRLYRHAYKLPDGYCNDEDFGCNADSPESLIMAELDSGQRGAEVMQVLTAYGYTIVETEALDQARAVLSRSGG